MEKYTYDTDNNEKLTDVRVNKVWLNEDLMPDDSEFKEEFPILWASIQIGVDAERNGVLFELKGLKRLITSNPELFIVIISTKSKSSTQGKMSHRQRAYLTDGSSFIEITRLLGLTNLVGCRFQDISPPYEDFINEFVGEVYF